MNTNRSEPSLSAWGSPTQADLLYPGQWTQAVDNRFIELLQDSKSRGLFSPTVINPDAVSFALEHLNFDLDTCFSYQDCADQLHILRKRYVIFRHLLRKHGVRYDEIGNTVSAPAWVWVQMYEIDPFVEAYMVNGDPSWTQLQDLFSEMYEAPPAAPNDVVQISSDSEINPTGGHNNQDRPRRDDVIVIDDSVESRHSGRHRVPGTRRGENSGRFSDLSVNQGQTSVDTFYSSTAAGPHEPVHIKRKGKRSSDSLCRGSNQI